MACQETKKMSLIPSPQSIILAKKAQQEWNVAGKIQVLCPKCKKAPEITMTTKGERTTVSCECGYIYNCEINL